MEENELLETIKRLQVLRQEWKIVDAKRELILQENGDKAEFVKDVSAMANNGEQSYLIIGLEDGTFTSVGHLTHHYSNNDLNQILAGKIDPPLSVSYQEFRIEGNEYALIEIFGHNPPYIVARDLIHNKQDRKQVKIYKGTIFVRHEDRTEGISRSELDAFFRSELRKEYEDETNQALEIALNRPLFWKYLLTAELLQSKTAKVRRSLSDLDRGLVYKRAVRMKGIDCLNWFGSRFDDFSALMGLLETAITEEIPASWGNQMNLEIRYRLNMLLRK
jgi:predicted HTH transcriptional regulator